MARLAYTWLYRCIRERPTRHKEYVMAKYLGPIIGILIGLALASLLASHLPA